MQILVLLILTGAAGGSISAYLSQGTENVWLGAASGVLVGAMAWIVLGIVIRTRREHRLDRYFVQDQDSSE